MIGQHSYLNVRGHITIDIMRLQLLVFKTKLTLFIFKLSFVKKRSYLLKQDKLIQCDNENFISETKQYSIETYTYYQRKQL